MYRYLSSFLIASVVFAFLDLPWLSLMSEKLYRPAIGEIMAAEFRKAPAIVFYVIYLLAIVWFAVRPALKSGKWSDALINGAALGLVCYATFDLTNQAVMKVWSTKISVIDICWGAYATSVTSALTAFLILKFGKS